MVVSILIIFQEVKINPYPTDSEDNSIYNVMKCTFVIHINSYYL